MRVFITVWYFCCKNLLNMRLKHYFILLLNFLILVLVCAQDEYYWFEFSMWVCELYAWLFYISCEHTYTHICMCMCVFVYFVNFWRNRGPQGRGGVVKGNTWKREQYYIYIDFVMNLYCIYVHVYFPQFRDRYT